VQLDPERDLGLPERAREPIRSCTLVSDYQTGGALFRIYIVEVEPDHLRRTNIRAVLEPFYTRFPQVSGLFVFTNEQYNPLVLVSPLRVLLPEDGSTAKLKLRILQIDRFNVYHTDLWVLSALKLPQGESDASTIWAKHLDAFSVEKVTQEFFKTYKGIFDLLKNGLKLNNRGNIFFKDENYIETFAQRILGRLIFLYFLQKKLWLNSDKKFINNLLEMAEKEKKNFYTDFLEPLFFKVLNVERANNGSPFGMIPYLNGGLFEKDYTFEVKLPNAIFKEIIGFFEQYNFTVQENTPLEVEVSLDPELLGKIFENMLAEKERGEKGTFYTLRPIVHYMCRESLKEYLATLTECARHKVRALLEDDAINDLSVQEAKQLDKALDEVCILDPAVGSGAFLVGMMHELIRLKTALATKLDKIVTNAQLKREIIKSNLYGVDIEPEAIEVARLRLWLSLVVDEKLEDIEPLPNLDYKLVVGNSLVESFQGMKILGKENLQRTWGEDVTLKLIRELRGLKDKLLDEGNPEEKKKLREHSEGIEWQLIESRLIGEAERKTREAIEISGRYKYAKAIPKKEKKKLEELREEAENAGKLLEDLKQSGSKSFFLPQIHFAEVFTVKGGFDIVIANPPYVRTQKLSELHYRDDLKLHYGFVDDLYVHFTFRAFELARPKGIVTFITSDTYLTLSWKERMRALLQDKRLQRLILTPKAFQATVNTAIYIAQNEHLGEYNFTFLDAREVSVTKEVSWEDQLIVFEGLKEVEEYDTQMPVRIGDKELEVSYSRRADIGQFRVPVELYKKAVKKVFFTPTEKNLKLCERYMPKMLELYDQWWPKIKSSTDIQENKKEIGGYLKKLKPGDVTLLGLIAEGGQGLATADNGRFLAVLEGTEEAKRIEERLVEFERTWERRSRDIKIEAKERREYQKIIETYHQLLKKYSRNDAIDKLRTKFGDEKLEIPRGFIYKIITKEDVFDVASYLAGLEPDSRDIMRRVLIFGGIPEKESDVKGLWKLPKLSDDLVELKGGLRDRVEEEYRKLTDMKGWVLLEKGDREGNRWFKKRMDFVLWSRSSLHDLQQNERARWQGYDYYFMGGFSSTNMSVESIKCRITPLAVVDHGAMTFFPMIDTCPSNYFIALLNADLMTYFMKNFINQSLNFELNDFKLLPIIIPLDNFRKEIDKLVEEAIEIQKEIYAAKNDNEKSEWWKELQRVQDRINEKVEGVYARVSTS